MGGLRGQQKGTPAYASVPQTCSMVKYEQCLLPALALPRSGSVGRWRLCGHPLSLAPQAPVAAGPYSVVSHAIRCTTSRHESSTCGDITCLLVDADQGDVEDQRGIGRDAALWRTGGPISESTGNNQAARASGLHALQADVP